MDEAVLKARLREKVLQIVTARVKVQDVIELRELWGPYPPTGVEITRALWDLRQQGEIKFREHLYGNASLITSIRLSQGIDSRTFHPNESRGRHPVGKDLTNPSSHHWIARGGPIERSRIDPSDPRIAEEPVTTDTHTGSTAAPDSDWMAYVAKINPDRVRAILPKIQSGINRPVLLQAETGLSSSRITSLVTRGKQLGWLTSKPFPGSATVRPGVELELTDEGARIAAESLTGEDLQVPHAEVAHVVSEVPHTDGIETDTHTEYQDAAPAETKEEPAVTRWPRIIDVVELEKYPLISELLTKETRIAKYEAAAALLEDIDPDWALSLLGKIQITPLEKEVIAFVNSLR